MQFRNVGQGKSSIALLFQSSSVIRKISSVCRPLNLIAHSMLSVNDIILSLANNDARRVFIACIFANKSSK